MNYYEELGLKPDASLDEIRQAYRSLTRLLHPDQHSNPVLRRITDRQMKRLNSINETLTDPVRRREYDARLGQALVVARPAAISVVRKAPTFSLRGAALVAVGIALALAWWRLASDRPSVAPQATAVSRPVPAASGESKPRRRDHVNRISQRRNLNETPARKIGTVSVPAVLEPPPAETVESAAPQLAHPVMPATVAPEPPPTPLDTPAPRFGGTWVYVRPRLPDSKRFEYSAEYVETVISEEGPQLRGRYRARYDIADRPISAEVIFRFEGKAGDNGATLRWTGAGGAEGDAKLVLLSANSLRIDWTATSLGTQIGLASGSAVLTRRREK